ncbi:MAG: hypothetical protein A3I89_02905 [Candidatus Harrisonbacteria bacterium RIFCSPLOWO2_02_FULL_41_11]|uniref:RNA 2-O ribose methyltransferase substrate binding domain-containing protein n=1 Tax=Candidatus Harrisonbacteria bacterium RIFCSPHIGHO2_02_FULL_42_16 TaxID=1798404 RepID=A0A1G1ZGT9_9BACT|nr:MAG: hypothetical protein A3B92_01340 [Candidatus Harrisonbacteria bacterium RIFCSPHIGHO2_02_FULL_42_16]OGY67331.1 MAG: hypothetical protein A3I89_02905 [Candidatus Harrisonbacteria bacterium RIFCSPLOWO2_02_FULL_41_11]
MPNSPEINKGNEGENDKNTEKKASPEKHAIHIQYEFLKRNPQYQEAWFDKKNKYSEKFREFFNKNKEQCVKLDDESPKELDELIKKYVIEENL